MCRADRELRALSFLLQDWSWRQAAFAGGKMLHKSGGWRDGGLRRDSEPENGRREKNSFSGLGEFAVGESHKGAEGTLAVATTAAVATATATATTTTAAAAAAAASNYNNSRCRLLFLRVVVAACSRPTSLFLPYFPPIPFQGMGAISLSTGGSSAVQETQIVLAA